MPITNKILLELQKLPPEKAIEYIKGQGVSIGFDYKETMLLVEKKLFAVTRAANMQVVQEIRSEIKKSLEQGTSYKTFQDNIENTLVKKGWYGRAFINREGRKIAVNQVPWRLKTIYETNVAGAINAGRFETQIDNSDYRPYGMLVEVIDPSTRTTHRKQSGSIAKLSSAFWKKWYPPNGYRCRGVCRTLTYDQAKKRGIKVKYPNINPDPGFERAPTDYFEPSSDDFDKDIFEAGKKMKQSKLK